VAGKITLLQDVNSEPSMYHRANVSYSLILVSVCMVLDELYQLSYVNNVLERTQTPQDLAVPCKPVDADRNSSVHESCFPAEAGMIDMSI